MGAATGDFDNDGCVDLYLTSLGPNALFRNNCDGTFTNVSSRSGTADPSWTVSAAFLDYDRDGWLDLFAGNYLSWRVDASAPCPTPSGRPDYCSPNTFQPQQSRLYRNNRQRHVHRRQRHGRASRTISGRRSACPPPTSTATAGSTSTSPTTASRTCCG